MYYIEQSKSLNLMRFFIALEIPESSRQELEVAQKDLKQVIPQARITNNGKLHLTIAFVGEQSDKMIGDLKEVLEKAAYEITPFQITPAYIDSFPNLHHPHTFWIGVKGDIDKLMVIRERVKDGLMDIGLDVDERRYTPHIAIAKINNNFDLSPDQEQQLQEIMSQAFSPIHINSLKLFESIPENGFHRHHTLAEIPLQPSIQP